MRRWSGRHGHDQSGYQRLDAPHSLRRSSQPQGAAATMLPRQRNRATALCGAVGNFPRQLVIDPCVAMALRRLRCATAVAVRSNYASHLAHRTSVDVLFRSAARSPAKTAAVNEVRVATVDSQEQRTFGVEYLPPRPSRQQHLRATLAIACRICPTGSLARGVRLRTSSIAIARCSRSRRESSLRCGVHSSARFSHHDLPCRRSALIRGRVSR